MHQIIETTWSVFINAVYDLSFWLPCVRLCINVENIETIILNHKAAHQFSTLKPGTNVATHLMITILITSKNNPKVNIVIGMVSNTNIGFTNVFKKPNTMAVSYTHLDVYKRQIK